MFYSIRHLTRFRYSAPVSASLMEARMQPRTEGPQRCLNFQLSVNPQARVFSYRDYLGNIVHHFDVPGAHRQLTIVAEALVDVQSPAELPEALPGDAWGDLARMVVAGDYWEMLNPSQFAEPTQLLEDLLTEFGMSDSERVRRQDPLHLIAGINRDLYDWIAYVPKTTRVDSPIDVALETRKGVCQDYAHIMTALVRRIGIPCRYVSGYLFHLEGEIDRSGDGATHAWVEVLLPGLGWVGFDPANNLVAGERHVRTAIGRDYADVPPTRGMYQGKAESELTVAVRVSLSDAPPPPEEESPGAEEWTGIIAEARDYRREQQQQQQ